MFDFDVRLVRIMPNINAEILMSATSLCKNEFASDKDLNVVKTCFLLLDLLQKSLKISLVFSVLLQVAHLPMFMPLLMPLQEVLKNGYEQKASS